MVLLKESNFYVVNEMSTRVLALENSIKDIIEGDNTAGLSVPQSPSPVPGSVRRSGSGST